MKIKLDGNIGRRGFEFLTEQGCDVMTVIEPRLGGAADDMIFKVRSAEGRVLITLDHDFGQVRRFPPEQAAGTVILELGPRPSLPGIEAQNEGDVA